MNHIKHFVISALMMLLTARAWAYDFEVDGIYYRITNNTAPFEVGVTYNNQSHYSGDIVIPSSVTYGGIDYSVTSIGQSAFSGSTDLTSVTIPTSVTGIGIWVFASCPELTSIIVTAGNSVYDSRNSCNAVIETATNKIIAGCKGTVIPNSVTSIGEDAFYRCAELTSITIPNSVTSIGEDAFCYCAELTSITIPSSVTSIGKRAFVSCPELTSIIVATGNPVYDSRNNCNAVVETATNRIIAGCKGTVIPNSVISIGEEAFLGCKGLTTINIPNSVTKIGKSAFGSSGLISLNIPNSVTNIEDRTFEYCSSLTSIIIPNSVTNIEDGTFVGCRRLASINIPHSVKSIGWEAFSSCESLTSLSIPNSVTDIAWEAFSNCDSLAEIVVETGNPKYDSRNNCNAIIETETNTLIVGCMNTTIPNSVTSIGYYAFESCTGLTSLSIPNSVTTIGHDAFCNCSGLTSITIPNSVTSIEGDAFYRCKKLTSITIPNSVTSIEAGAFSGCKGLTMITVLAETLPELLDEWGGVFVGVNTGIPVYVPCVSQDAYASTNWGGFNNFIGICPGEITVNTNPTGGGTVHGTGYYEGGVTCTLTATANEGFFFGSWKKDGTVISYDPTYSFTVLGDATYEAYFPKKEECIQFADINVKAKCVALWDTNNDGELSYDEARTVTDLWQVFSYDGVITSFDELQYFSGLTTIGGNEFNKCSSLTSIMLPNSVSVIGDGAFSNCVKLSSIIIPNSVESIAGNPFRSCSELSSILVDKENRYYDSRNNCNAIIETATNTLIAGCNTTVIPNSVVSIEKNAFSGCSGLTSIDIPNSVLSIGRYAFYECTSLTSITIGESVKEMDVILYNCKSLNQLVYNAIDCISVIPASAPGPFFRSATKAIIIGNDVKGLPEGFWSIEVEDHIIVRASVPPQNYGYKTLSSFDTPICVPTRSLSVYQNDGFWGQFTNYNTSYLFDVRSSDETIGSVRIVEQPDCYSDNNIATILAEPIGDHPFINWTSNGQVISTANPYTFAVEDDVELVANFYGTGVDEELERQILVSPNPTKGEVIVEGVIMKSMVVFTMDGRVSRVYEGLNTDAVSLDFKDLPQGVYMLRITTQNGAVINKKIIKE